MFLAKIYAYGPKEYWVSNWHKLDVLCLIGNLGDLFFRASAETVEISNALLAIRSLRLLIVLNLFETFAVMMGTILLTIQAVAPFVFLYFSFIYVYAVMGMAFFSETIISASTNEALQASGWWGLRHCINFDSFGNSIFGMGLLGVHGSWFQIISASDAVSTNGIIPGRVFFQSYRMLSFLVFLPCFFGFILQMWGACSPISAKRYRTEYDLETELLKMPKPTKEGKALKTMNSMRLEGNVVADMISSKTSLLQGAVLKEMKGTKFFPKSGIKGRKVMQIKYKDVMLEMDANKQFSIEEKIADAKLMRSFLTAQLAKANRGTVY